MPKRERVGRRLVEVQARGTLVAHQFVAGRTQYNTNAGRERHTGVTSKEALDALLSTHEGSSRIMIAVLAVHASYGVRAFLPEEQRQFEWKNAVTPNRETMKQQLLDIQDDVARYKLDLQDATRARWNIPQDQKLSRSFAQSIAYQTRVYEQARMVEFTRLTTGFDVSRVQSLSFADAPLGWKWKSEKRK